MLLLEKGAPLIVVVMVTLLSSSTLAQERVVIRGAPLRPLGGAGIVDPPGPPLTSFSVPLVDEPHCKAWREFRTMLSDRQWSKAFRAVSDDLERPPEGLLPPDGGLALEWISQVQRDLGGIELEGRRAFELFFGGRAKKLFEDAMEKDAGDAERQAALAVAFRAYGLTTAGTKAGEQLAAALFESGGADAEVVEILEWIIKSGATDGYDPRKVRLGLCKAFARLEWRADFDRVAASLEDRWGVLPEPSSRPESTASAPASRGERLTLPDVAEIGWETEPPEAPKEKRANRGEARPVIVGRNPGRVIMVNQGQVENLLAVAVEGDTAYVSDGNRIRAIDVHGGQVKWARGHHWKTGNVWAAPWIVPQGDVLLTGELREGLLSNFSCREKSDGSQRWLAGLDRVEDCLGIPFFEKDEIYVVFRDNGSTRTKLCSLDSANGKKRWTVELGTAPGSAAEDWNWRGAGRNWWPADARILKAGRRLVVFLDGGTVLSVDSVTRKIRWAALLDEGAGLDDSQARFRLVREGSIAYATFRGNRDLVALDFERARVCWRRRVAAEGGLVTMDRERIYVQGDELCAYSRQDRRLLWSRPLVGVRDRMIETRDFFYVVFAGGLHEIGKADGDDARVLRGSQIFFRGGDLWAAETGFVCAGSGRVSFLRGRATEGERPTTVPESRSAESRR